MRFSHRDVINILYLYNYLAFYCLCKDVDVRFVGQRCAGTLELKHEGKWRLMSASSSWPIELSTIACRQMSCGAALSTKMGPDTQSPVWRISGEYTSEPLPTCDGSESSIKKCTSIHAEPKMNYYMHTVQLVCSGNTS